MPAVSIVLTSYNHAKYIRETIDSVISQTFSDWELFIFDDASTDVSWSIIQSYNDPRITAFCNTVNQGPTFAFNKVIFELATGSYIAIHHSDDVWEINKLRDQVHFLEANPNIGAVFSNALAIDDRSAPLADPTHFYYDIFDQPNRTRHEWLRSFFFSGNALCHPSVLIRKHCYEDCGPYPDLVHQSPDFNMWIRLCMKYEIHVMPERLVKFRVRDNEANTSGSRPETRIRGVYEFYKILDLFLAIRDKEEFFKVFPSMASYDRGEDTDTEFVLAMTAFEEVTFCTKQLFGADILFRILSDSVRAKKIKSLYGFGYKEFIELTGRYDFFSREELSGLRQQLHSQAEQNASLNQVILEKDGVIRQQAGEIARLANEVGDLTAESEALQSEMQWLKGAAPDESAFVAAHRKRLDELTSEIARVEQLSANWNESQIYLHSLRLDLAETAKRLDESEASRAALGRTLHSLRLDLAETAKRLDASEATLSALRRTKVFRLRDVLLHHPWGIRKILHIAYLVVALLTPRFLRTAAAPLTIRLRQMAATPAFPHAEPVSHAEPEAVAEPDAVAEPVAVAKPGPVGELDPVAQSEVAGEYGDSISVVRKSKVARTNAPKIAHVIANFMTGGSSRLVVDLIEYLGSEYRHSVITSFIPTPPAYVGLEIEECRAPENELAFVEYFQRVQADFVHVHYWGDSDEPWYAKAILAAEHLGLPVIENVNTPVAPYLSEAVARYVYVSDYARRVFGQCDPRHITIYPGSNFSRFDRGSDEALPENCVGMVYRLERDKLNERSIEPFIRIAQRRPQTRILIVGGGGLLEPFQEAVRLAGVSQSFEFTGYVGYEELPGLYRRMTVFVAPVWKESFGQVSPFAMNMRVPVVGYGVGAIGEIVEAPELLAPPGDAEKLADIAIELLDNPDQREQIGEMQRDRAEANFSLQAMIRGYAKIYAEMRRQ